MVVAFAGGSLHVENETADSLNSFYSYTRTSLTSSRIRLRRSSTQLRSIYASKLHVDRKCRFGSVVLFVVLKNFCPINACASTSDARRAVCVPAVHDTREDQLPSLENTQSRADHTPYDQTAAQLESPGDTPPYTKALSVRVLMTLSEQVPSMMTSRFASWR